MKFPTAYRSPMRPARRLLTGTCLALAALATGETVQAACPSAFDRCEAESADQQNGTRTVNAARASGGKQLGYVNNGDWVLFRNVDFGANGSTAATIRYTKGSNTPTSVELRLGSVNGPLIGSREVDSTGGWRTLRQDNFEISRTTGEQALYVVFNGGNGYLVDLDWIEFTPSGGDEGEPVPPPTPAPTPTSACASAYATCEAESFEKQQGVRNVLASQARGGAQVGYINNGDWIAFEGVDFGATGARSGTLRYTKGSGSNARVELRLGSVTAN